MASQRLTKLRTLRQLRAKASAESGKRSDGQRLKHLERHRNALDLACELNPRTVRTPALELIADALERAATTPGLRLIISVPPQEGKSTSCVYALARKLQRHPESTNVIASYGADLATDFGREVRSVIDGNGLRAADAVTGQSQDKLGIAVRQDHAAAGNWSLEGHGGGLYSIGVGGGLTGRSATGMFVVDDPIKGMTEADSSAVREKVWKWWTSVSETRMAPETSVVVIQTRWHPLDLAGRLIAADEELPPEEREWEVINIPALATPNVRDSLAGVEGGRDAEGWLVSARGRTAKMWRAIRRRVQERVFGALYQGDPQPVEGGIFKQEWIAAHRVRIAPPKFVTKVLTIDPADTGEGDAAGILIGGRTPDGDLYVLADLSGQLSQRQWARTSLLGVLQHGVDTILQENNLGMGRALKDEWSLIQRQALVLRDDTDHDADARTRATVAAGVLAARNDKGAAKVDELIELLPLIDTALARPSTGPCLMVTVTPRLSKYVRAKAVTGLYETGRAHHVGTFAELELEQTTWQEGQESPNRLDTLAHLLTHLDTAARDTGVSSPSRSGGRGGRVPTRTASDPRRSARRR